MRKLKIFIITGEKSGCDILRNILLKLKIDFKLELSGICNVEFEESFHIKKIFDLKEISFMGIIDVLLNLRKILRRINQTVKAIFLEKPDLIISVDSFDFCYRVIKKFREKFDKNITRDIDNHFKLPKLIHIVAPAVWLYKKNRAQKLAQFYDLLLTIIPDEEKFFTKFNLKTYFIGNPAFYKDNITNEEREKFTLKLNNFNQKAFVKNNIKNISITIGSRIQEIKKHLKIIKETIINLDKYCEDKDFEFSFKILSTIDTCDLISESIKDLNREILKKIEIITDQKYKDFIVKNSSFAIAKSGTNTFDFISNKIPFLVYYKTSWINIFIAIFFLRLKFVNLLNIIANKPIIPEFLQHRANATNITNFVINFFENQKNSNSKLSLQEYDKYINKFKSPNNSNPFELGSFYIKSIIE